MTLIEVHGAGEGRCDARCYNAVGGKCRCVCGGMNHGIGLEAAEKKTGEHSARLVGRYGPRTLFAASTMAVGALFP